jgi:uncharacterized protein YecA (UPF0149 family)
MSTLLQFGIEDNDRRREVERQSLLIERIARGYNPYLERQQELARIRRALVHRDSTKKKVGRNDMCPCGSGKKFKQCCLRKR